MAAVFVAFLVAIPQPPPPPVIALVVKVEGTSITIEPPFSAPRIPPGIVQGPVETPPRRIPGSKKGTPPAPAAGSRKTIKVTPTTTIVRDNEPATVDKIAPQDSLFIVFDPETRLPSQVFATSLKAREKHAASKKDGGDRLRGHDEARAKAKADAEKNKKELQKGIKDFQDGKPMEAFDPFGEKPVPHAKRFDVRDMGWGAIGFGPFETHFGDMTIKASIKREQVELVVLLANPPFPPRFGSPREAGTLKLPTTLEIESHAIGLGGGFGGGSTTRITSEKKPKRKDGPDDIKELKKLLDDREKDEDARWNGGLKPARQSNGARTVKFRVPLNAEINDGDRIELRFGEWKFKFDEKNDPKVVTAFKNLFEKLRSK